MRNKTKILSCLAVILLCFVCVSAQTVTEDPGHKENTEIDGIRFSVPQDFTLQKSSNAKVAIMRHEEIEDLALFVAIVEKTSDNKYLTELSNFLLSQLFPNEGKLKWKVVPALTDQKVSKFQIARGHTKGINKSRLFQSDYKILKVKNREIIVGYITELGNGSNISSLFEPNRPMGGSAPGWNAQAHVIASVTNEKYEEINPPAVLKVAPLTKED